jgi:hypothetical protein
VLRPERKADAATVKLGFGAAAVAIVCCAGLPAVAALVGGLTVGAILGLGLGALIVGAVALTGGVMLTRKRRHARSSDRDRQQ